MQAWEIYYRKKNDFELLYPIEFLPLPDQSHHPIKHNSLAMEILHTADKPSSFSSLLLRCIQKKFGASFKIRSRVEQGHIKGAGYIGDSCICRFDCSGCGSKVIKEPISLLIFQHYFPSLLQQLLKKMTLPILDSSYEAPILKVPSIRLYEHISSVKFFKIHIFNKLKISLEQNLEFEGNIFFGENCIEMKTICSVVSRIINNNSMSSIKWNCELKDFHTKTYRIRPFYKKNLFDLEIKTQNKACAKNIASLFFLELYVPELFQKIYEKKISKKLIYEKVPNYLRKLKEIKSYIEETHYDMINPNINFPYKNLKGEKNKDWVPKLDFLLEKKNEKIDGLTDISNGYFELFRFFLKEKLGTEFLLKAEKIRPLKNIQDLYSQFPDFCDLTPELTVWSPNLKEIIENRLKNYLDGKFSIKIDTKKINNLKNIQNFQITVTVLEKSQIRSEKIFHIMVDQNVLSENNIEQIVKNIGLVLCIKEINMNFFYKIIFLSLLTEIAPNQIPLISNTYLVTSSYATQGARLISELETTSIKATLEKHEINKLLKDFGEDQSLSKETNILIDNFELEKLVDKLMKQEEVRIETFGTSGDEKAEIVKKRMKEALTTHTSPKIAFESLLEGSGLTFHLVKVKSEIFFYQTDKYFKRQKKVVLVILNTEFQNEIVLENLTYGILFSNLIMFIRRERPKNLE